VTPLARIMDEHGLRVADVSALAGVGRAVIASLRAGRYAGVTVRCLVEIGRAVGVAPSALVPGLDVAPGESGQRITDARRLVSNVRARLARDSATAARASALARRAEARAVAGVARAAESPEAE